MEEPEPSEVLKMYQTTLESNKTMMETMMKQLKELQEGGENELQQHQTEEILLVTWAPTLTQWGRMQQEKGRAQGRSHSQEHHGWSNLGIGKAVQNLRRWGSER